MMLTPKRDGGQGAMTLLYFKGSQQWSVVLTTIAAILEDGIAKGIFQRHRGRGPPANIRDFVATAIRN